MRIARWLRLVLWRMAVSRGAWHGLTYSVHGARRPHDS